MVAEVVVVLLLLVIVPVRAALIETEVLVLGAGAAGIGAGKTLLDRGVSDFLILEGRDEVGGRVRSKVLQDGTIVEEGANWLYQSGAGPNPIYDTADQLGLNFTASNWDSTVTYSEASGSKVVNDNNIPWEEFDQAWTCAIKKSEQLQNDYVKQGEPKQCDACEASFPCSVTYPAASEQDQSFRASLKECGWEPKNAIDYATEWFTIDWDFGAAAEKLGTSGSYAQTKPRYTWRDADLMVHDQAGFGSVLEKLGESFLGDKVVLGARVRTIEYAAGSVRVTVDRKDGQQDIYSAKHAIVTFSTGVLQKGVVDFQPALPTWKTKAIESLPLGQYTKVFLQFDQAFWDDTFEYFMFAANDRGKFPIWINLNKFTSFAGKNILVAHLVDDLSAQAANSSPEQVLNEAIKYLRTMFPGAPEPRDFHVTAWASDEWSYGVYSFRPSGAHSSAANVLAHPLESALHFAGEATSPTMYGYVHGAWFSGERAALEILACRSSTATTEGISCPKSFEQIQKTELDSGKCRPFESSAVEGAKEGEEDGESQDFFDKIISFVESLGLPTWALIAIGVGALVLLYCLVSYCCGGGGEPTYYGTGPMQPSYGPSSYHAPPNLYGRFTFRPWGS